MSVPPHPQEEDRLACLSRIEILDTGTEDIYDDFVKLAAAIAQTPIAMISLVGRNRQWFKASVGVDFKESNRCDSMCTHTILSVEPLIVLDALTDPRFSNSPLVTGPSGFRFYVGIPIFVENLQVGSLCVVDNVPRTLEPYQLSALSVLARQITACLETRLEKVRNQELVAKIELLKADVAMKEITDEFELEEISVPAYLLDNSGKIFDCNSAATFLTGLTPNEVVGHEYVKLIECNVAAESTTIYGQEYMATVLTKSSELLETKKVVLPFLGYDGESIGSIVLLASGVFGEPVVSLRLAANDIMQSLALDPTTKLLKRTEGLDAIERMIEDEGEINIAIFSIANFADLHLKQGQSETTLLLKQFAEIVRRNLKKEIKAIRYGIDEIIIASPPKTAAALLRAARKIVVESEARLPKIQIAYGLASGKDLDTKEKAISIAEVRMHKMKQGHQETA